MSLVHSKNLVDLTQLSFSLLNIHNQAVLTVLTGRFAGPTPAYGWVFIWHPNHPSCILSRVKEFLSPQAEGTRYHIQIKIYHQPKFIPAITGKKKACCSLQCVTCHISKNKYLYRNHLYLVIHGCRTWWQGLECCGHEDDVLWRDCPAPRQEEGSQPLI